MKCINCKKNFSVGNKKKRYYCDYEDLNFCSIECVLGYYALKNITTCKCGHAVGTSPCLCGGMLFCCQNCAFKFLGIEEIEKEDES